MLVKRLAKDRQKFDREQGIDPSKNASKIFKRKTSKRRENKNKDKKTIGKRLVINGKNQKIKNLKNFKIL